MGTPYSFIYKRAITEFKDPTLKQLMSNNQILFFQVMENYMDNAISMFTNPKSTNEKLHDAQKPILVEEVFTSNGNNTKFILAEYPEEAILDEVVFECTVDNESVSCKYDNETHTVEIVSPVEEGKNVYVSWYFIGSFNHELEDRESYILSQFIVACWSEYIFNDKLDIIRLLGDTDFKLPANGTTTTAKVGWNIVNRETVTKRMNNYAWAKALSKWGKKS